MTALSIWVTGFIASISLVAMIGAQNTMVLRQGIRRDHIGVVVLVCTLSDMLMIASGTAGVGALVGDHPRMMRTLAWVGAAYLVGYAVTSFRSALRPKALVTGGAGSLRTAVVAVLAATYLNPQAYLDTIVLLGSLANQHGPARWTFAAGALTASALWFAVLGFGARALAGPLGRPRTWRWIDTGVGVTMLGLATRLVLVA
ncbi:L-lysine exporter family protein LysE/ArgO [Raineyella antarctica]|uniref:L-lysine exporter family protein LysE/ArgO n=1 Tax=Raineyella antarctica TaxID=1577474 RepID=A0A1G6H749_9ACTN|nr:LysE/ArgO family amino acid transporter [Raineyella antarctica]SDB90109.1 L-lysine exporter family protein LysE/ArgO [Raineyella antarctica]